MKNKKWTITILTALVVFAMLTTAAYAADDDDTFGRGFGQRADDRDRLFQNISEDCDEDCTLDGLQGYGHGYMYSEDWISELVSDGLITQAQADSILAGEAHVYDFVSPEDCPAYSDGERPNYNSDSPRGRFGRRN